MLTSVNYNFVIIDNKYLSIYIFDPGLKFYVLKSLRS